MKCPSSSARSPPKYRQATLSAATSSIPSNKQGGVYGHTNFTRAMDTGYLHAVHGIPPNDSIYAGRVEVSVLVVWAMATLDLMFDRTQRNVWRGCGCGNIPNYWPACTRFPCCRMATPRRRGVMAYDNLGGSTVRNNASALLCAQRMRVAPARLARGGPIAHATQSRTQCGCAGMSDWNAIHIYRCRFNARPRCLHDKLFGALNELLPPPPPPPPTHGARLVRSA